MNAGGVERGTLELADYYVRQGHASIVISHGGRMVPALEQAGSRHISLPVHRKNPLTLLQVHALRRFLTNEKPDILHIRSRIPGWVAWLAWCGMDPDTRPRLVSTVHGFYSVNRYSAVMTRGERVIAVSESIRRYLIECYPGIDPSRIRVVPRGIEPAAYPSGYQPPADWHATWLSTHPELHGKVTLLLPGRITRLKGHEDLFRLIATLKHMGIPAHGLVAGDTHPKKTSYLSELKELVHTLGLANDVSFLGHCTDLREIMAVSDLVCALSQQPESFGRTVLEALALGKPVVGYDCGGVGELLAEFFASGLIPPGDSTRLAEISSHIIRTRPAPSSVGDPYTLESMRSGTLAVYHEVCASAR
jgi:glycosyltransferase involved in cell wall biosynthesis